MSCECFSPWVKSQNCRLKKIVCNPQEKATQAEGCIDLCCIAKFIHLNVSALSTPDSLFINLTIPKHSLTSCTLLDCSSSHCFIDLLFVTSNKIPTFLVPLIGLCLFDGTWKIIITQVAELLVVFSTGESFNLTFYVTPLDSSYSMVLGYSWLKQYNLLIDWVSGQIIFCSIDHRGPALSMSPVVATPLLQNPPLVDTPLVSEQSLIFGSNHIPKPFPEIPNPIPDPIPISNPIPDPIPKNPKPTWPNISMINAAAYMCTSKLPGSVTFQLQLTPDGIFSRVTMGTLLDLSSVPMEFEIDVRGGGEWIIHEWICWEVEDL